MKEGQHRIPYRSMQDAARLGILAKPFYSELCYTEEELQFRQRIINLRSTSKIDTELLKTEDSWFNEDKEQAFLAVNENSWVLNLQYRPRHELSLDDFHVELLPPQRVIWSGLSVMMRHIGDYLLLRNSDLSPAHLNQPFNYVLLDCVQILRKLAAINDAEYVSEQLRSLTQYLRSVEVMISPTSGSDRLFLDDCRNKIEKDIQFDIQQKMQSRQFKIKIERLYHELTNLAEKRHTGMHFAITGYDANPHPFWELYKHSEPVTSHREFPTLAAKRCAQPIGESIQTFGDAENIAASPPPIRLTGEDLNQCAEFKFIDHLPHLVHESYGQAISDLQEVLRFQHILGQLTQLLDQAGEVFTITQFRTQMLDLFEGIEVFVKRSQTPVFEVLEANSAAYHQSIQDKQDIRWWEKWVSDKQERLDSFINNQDNLARFGVTTVDLHQVEKQIMEQTNQIKSHLHQFASEEKQLELISSAKELMQQVMQSMESWVNQQNRLAGLSEKFTAQQKITPLPKDQQSLKTGGKQTDRKKRIAPSTKTSNQKSGHCFFRSTPQPMHQMFVPPAISAGQRAPLSSPLPLAGTSTTTHGSVQPVSIINPAFFLATLFLLPLTILLLKLLYDSWHTAGKAEDNNCRQTPDPATFNKDMVAADDALAKVAGYILAYGNEEDQLLLEDFTSTAKQLRLEQTGKRYDQSALDTLILELDDFIQEHHLGNPCTQTP